MKLIIVLAAVSLARAAKLDRVYLPPNACALGGRYTLSSLTCVSGGSGNFLQTPRESFRGQPSQDNNAYASNAYNQNAYNQNAYNQDVYNQNAQAYAGFEGRPERAQAALERNAAILRQDNSNDGETYSYAYETENGIYAEESGLATNGVQAQGGYSYTGDDGKVYSVSYTADENGFQPQGDHLPTPPPVPEAILRALEQNARDEAAGIYDDGSYNDAKYSDNNQQQYYNQNAQAIQSQSQPINYNEDAVVTNAAVFRNGPSFNTNSATEKAYLPPFQRNQIGARRPSFNGRSGYRY